MKRIEQRAWVRRYWRRCSKDEQETPHSNSLSIIIREQCTLLMISDILWRCDYNPLAYWQMQSQHETKNRWIANGDTYINCWLWRLQFYSVHMHMRSMPMTDNIIDVRLRFVYSLARINPKLTVAQLVKLNYMHMSRARCTWCMQMCWTLKHLIDTVNHINSPFTTIYICDWISKA